MKSIKELPDTFIGIGEVKGFEFKKVITSENYYIYEVTSGSSTHYESFYRKSVPICIDFDNREYSDTEYKEVYPKAKDFSLWAWTSKTLDEATNLCSRFN